MKSKLSELPSGHGWAYAGVLLGLSASIAGNVANTVLVEDTRVPLLLRIILAVFWPVALGVGIEVLTRIEWRRGWKHWAARIILIGPLSLVAAIVSYIHLHHLMLLAGENGTAQALGPLAIDGTLFGCTVALLVTRKGADIVTEVPERIVYRTPDLLPIVPFRPPVLRVPKVPARRVPVSSGRPPAWDVVKAVHLIMEGARSNGDIAAVVGVGDKMVQRTRRAVTLLMNDRHAVIPAEWKVPTAVIEIARQEVAR